MEHKNKKQKKTHFRRGQYVSHFLRPDEKFKIIDIVEKDDIFFYELDDELEVFYSPSVLVEYNERKQPKETNKGESIETDSAIVPIAWFQELYDRGDSKTKGELKKMLGDKIKDPKDISQRIYYNLYDQYLTKRLASMAKRLWDWQFIKSHKKHEPTTILEALNNGFRWSAGTNFHFWAGVAATFEDN